MSEKTLEDRSITPEQFMTNKDSATRPMVVDVWAPWCAPCKVLTPLIERLAKEYDESIDTFFLNAEDYKDFVKTQGIRAVPTVLFFEPGKTPVVLTGPTANAMVIQMKYSQLAQWVPAEPAAE